jgi:ABC-type sugar transport system ATPase subunit
LAAFGHNLVLYPHVNRHQNIVCGTYRSHKEAEEESDRVHRLADILSLRTKLQGTKDEKFLI